MKKILYIILFSLITLAIFSCAGEEPFYSDPFTDTTAPFIEEVTFVTTPTNDSTPDYTFSSDEAGTITYGGSCSSSTTSAVEGNNTITLVSLNEGTYSDCTITVTDEAGNISIKLTITSFIVDTTVPVISGSTITTPTNDSTPNYTFSSDEAGTITYGGSCSSANKSAISGNNIITLNSLSDGTYSNCTLTVTDSAGNSVTLNITSFTVAIPPTIEEVTFVTTPTNDSTPDYTFSSDEAGTITYGGSCSSTTTFAIVGDNTITLVSLNEETYSDCTITVTDSTGNVSNTITLTSFIVDLTAATLEEVTAVTTPTNDSTPDYTFSSSEAGRITYGGSCFSITTSATTDNNTITLISLSDGPYSDCTITVTDSAGNSVTRNISSFVIDTTAPTVSSFSPTDNQSSVAITDNITVTFSEAMDNTSVTTNTDNASCSGTLGVSSDNFSSCVQMSSGPASSSDNITFTLDPSDNLSYSTTYKIRVTTGVKDSVGNTLSSQYETSSGFTTLLPAPDNLSASGANNTITLTWNTVSGATSYTLYWDNVSGIDSSDTAITSITNDNYTHNNMDNGSTYYYKVAAVNSSGTGTLSSVASALLSANIQGSQTYNAHTYAITSSAMNHADATAAAAALGGYLVTITTKAENDWLTATFETIYGDIWIGAKDVISEGTWVWDNGTGENFSSSSVWPSDNTRKFCSNEPNGSGDCAQIYQASGCWDDTTCNTTKLGIIEFD